MTACNGEIFPVVIERPCVEGVGRGVFPEEGVAAVDVGSSKSLPTGVNAVVELCAISSGDGNGVAAVDGGPVNTIV